jgi:hypothetical protein
MIILQSSKIVNMQKKKVKVSFWPYKQGGAYTEGNSTGSLIKSVKKWSYSLYILHTPASRHFWATSNQFMFYKAVL